MEMNTAGQATEELSVGEEQLVPTGETSNKKSGRPRDGVWHHFIVLPGTSQNSKSNRSGARCRYCEWSTGEQCSITVVSSSVVTSDRTNLQVQVQVSMVWKIVIKTKHIRVPTCS